jgi:hypothetical protein
LTVQEFEDNLGDGGKVIQHAGDGEERGNFVEAQQSYQWQFEHSKQF